MLHNTRNRPLPYKPKRKFERLSWRQKMTLCIAAACIEGDDPYSDDKQRIVVCADPRIQTDVASGDVGTKHTSISNNLWAMYSGDTSQAQKLAGTCREVLGGLTVDYTDVLFEKLNEASATHKRRLCDEMAQLKFGISYERLLTNGREELPEDSRLRFFHRLEDLDYQCDLLIAGFVGNSAVIYYIDDRGEVSQRENFAAIGSGSAIAEGNLFFRQQHGISTVERTLYCVYESTRLAYEAKAPGVGQTLTFLKLEPSQQGILGVGRMSAKCLGELTRLYEQKYGPRTIGDEIDGIEPDSWEDARSPMLPIAT